MHSSTRQGQPGKTSLPATHFLARRGEADQVGAPDYHTGLPNNGFPSASSSKPPKERVVAPVALEHSSSKYVVLLTERPSAGLTTTLARKVPTTSADARVQQEMHAMLGTDCSRGVYTKNYNIIGSYRSILNGKKKCNRPPRQKPPASAARQAGSATTTKKQL